MPDTLTRKLAKRYTPFSYARTVTGALRRTLAQFRDSVIVLSYSSNAVPDASTICALIREVKTMCRCGRWSTPIRSARTPPPTRRAAREYLFTGR